MVHGIIEGKWGDTLNASKIVAFYRKPGSEGNETKAIILQAISNGVYKKLKFDPWFGIGVYPETSTIVSVFFYDVDDNGLKELIIVESGAIRCSTEIVRYNEETKKDETITVGASCEDCGYKIYGQNMNSDTVDPIGGDENYEWQCNAKTIKDVLNSQKKKQNDGR